MPSCMESQHWAVTEEAKLLQKPLLAQSPSTYCSPSSAWRIWLPPHSQDLTLSSHGPHQHVLASQAGCWTCCGVVLSRGSGRGFSKWLHAAVLAVTSYQHVSSERCVYTHSQCLLPWDEGAQCGGDDMGLGTCPQCLSWGAECPRHCAHTGSTASSHRHTRRHSGRGCSGRS